MATLFKDYSLELVLNPETLRVCGGNAQLAWEHTRDRAIRMMWEDIDTNLTIGLRKELPIQIVKRPPLEQDT